MKRFKEFITRQHFIFWFITAALTVPNVMMFFTESTSTLTRVVQIVLPFAFYWWAMTLSAKPGKMFWALFIVAFYDAFQIVLLKLYGETPLAVDMLLNVTTTNVTEVDELLGNLLPAVSFAVILYMMCIILSIVSIRKKEPLARITRLAERRRALIALAVAVPLLVANYFVTPGFKARIDIFPVNAAFNTGLAVQRFYQTSRYEDTSSHFSYHATATRPDSVPQITVLVIGETARADNFAIYGYPRPTTPHLSAMSDLVVYRDAITMSNTTHKSVPLLLSAVGNETWDSIYHQKGIITAFNEAGYQTVFYSNQRRNHSFIDFFGSEAHEVVFTKDSVAITDNVLDSELKRLVQNRLQRYDGGKLLIVVHCYGSHFNYSDRYPESDAAFKPDNVIQAEKSQRDKLINAYDNTIHFDDTLLNDIIAMLKQQNVPAVLAFTSDHGEDIYDDERDKFLHASPLPTYYQLRVPMLFWASAQFHERYPLLWRNLDAHKALPISTNMVLFHTMLQLSGISTSFLDKSLALTDETFKPRRRLYVTDHNEYHPLDSVGLKPLDIEQFRKHGLQYP